MHRARHQRALLRALIAASVVFAAPVSAQKRNPERDAFFGETHIHTSRWCRPTCPPSRTSLRSVGLVSPITG